MKALVYQGPEILDFRDVPDPVAGDGEALVKVAAVGICGSDMHAYLGHDARRPAPLILGHEAAGTVVGGPGNGRRVTINPLVNCQSCPACRAGRENLCPERQIISMQPREGAFAERVAVPERNLVTVPDHVSLDTAALVEPLAVSWHAVKLALDTLHASMERRALVIGGGAIGVAAARALRVKGIEEVDIIEPNKARCGFLREVCGLNALEEIAGSYPLVIEAVGYGVTRAAASSHVQPGGVISHVGLGDSDEGLDIRRLTLQEITFIGTYTYTMQDFRDTADALFAGQFGAVDWITTRPLAEGAQAFKDIRAGKIPHPKIVLQP